MDLTLKIADIRELIDASNMAKEDKEKIHSILSDIAEALREDDEDA